MRDTLERLKYRTEQLLDKLAKQRTKVPVWPLMTIERALELADEQLEYVDEEKEAVLDKVREVWYNNPELRFMQLLENAGWSQEYEGIAGEKIQGCCSYGMRDEELIKRLGEVYD